MAPETPSRNRLLCPLSLAATSRRRSYRQPTLAECLQPSSSPLYSRRLVSTDSDENSDQEEDGSGYDADRSQVASRPAKRMRTTVKEAGPSVPPPPPIARKRRSSPPHDLASRLSAFSLCPSASARQRLAQAPMDSRLCSLISSREDDELVIHDDEGETSAPYTLSFSGAAKRGLQSGLLALGTEPGDVVFLDASAEGSFTESAAQRARIEAHSNAVFAVAWSPSDSLIATASADYSSMLFDVETGERVAALAGHKGTVRYVEFDGEDERRMVTGSRDGAICIWDTRVINSKPHSREEVPNYAPAIHIRNAHDDLYAHSRGPRPRGAAVPSISGAHFLPWGRDQIISTASADGVVKLWDLRYVKRLEQSIHPRCVEASGQGEEEKGRGIAKSVLSRVGDRLYTLGTDSVIRTHDTSFLARPHGSSYLPSFSPPHLATSSYYSALAISPDDRLLACSSSNGLAYLYTAGTAGPAVCLKGRGKTEINGVDWSFAGLATADDWGSVRRWRYDPCLVSSLTDADGERARLDWFLAARETRDTT